MIKSAKVELESEVSSCGHILTDDLDEVFTERAKSDLPRWNLSKFL